MSFWLRYLWINFSNLFFLFIVPKKRAGFALVWGGLFFYLIIETGAISRMRRLKHFASFMVLNDPVLILQNCELVTIPWIYFQEMTFLINMSSDPT